MGVCFLFIGRFAIIVAVMEFSAEWGSNSTNAVVNSHASVQSSFVGPINVNYSSASWFA